MRTAQKRGLKFIYTLKCNEDKLDMNDDDEQQNGDNKNIIFENNPHSGASFFAVH